MLILIWMTLLRYSSNLKNLTRVAQILLQIPKKASQFSMKLQIPQVTPTIFNREYISAKYSRKQAKIRPRKDITHTLDVQISDIWNTSSMRSRSKQLDNKAVLHVVDTHTHFNSAAFLQGHSVEDVWAAFLKCWDTIYVGFPEEMKVDQRSCFTSLR